MPYKKVTIANPNEFITALSTYATEYGWQVLYEGNDLPIDGAAETDGKRLVIKSPGGQTLAHFRSANGRPIFPTQPAIDKDHPSSYSKYANGVGLTCSTEYKENPASGLWYDQVGATKDNSGVVVGVGIPLLIDTQMDVYFNHVSDPAELIIASVQLFPGEFVHIAVGELLKIGSWTGGTIYSASFNCNSMFTLKPFNASVLEAGSSHLFGVNMEANTFLRINVDAAPLREPEVLWAGCGDPAKLGYTGKRIALPIVNKGALTSCPKIPHYGYLQSQTPADFGRNVNTLNCISVNLPLAVYILRDPDALQNFSQCGYVPGVYFISTRNVAPCSIYSVDYPSSGLDYQAFPQTSRGGNMGYDGIAVKQ